MREKSQTKIADGFLVEKPLNWRGRGIEKEKWALLFQQCLIVFQTFHGLKR